jgi:hypothetical protein
MAYSNNGTICMECVHAYWRKSTSGRLAVAGDGECTYSVPEFPIPSSMWWAGSPMRQPLVSGGVISRRGAENAINSCMTFMARLS